MDPSQATPELLTAINTLKYGAMVFIFLFFIAWRLFAWLDKRAAERAKKDRADAYATAQVNAANITATANEKLADSITELVGEIQERARKIEERYAGVSDGMHEVAENVEDLSTVMRDFRDRQAGVINRPDSFRIIEAEYFKGSILHEIVGVFEVSLERNDYENRADFIRRKVKTALGDVLARARKALEDYALSVDHQTYFKTYNEHGERFALCDDLWDAVVRYYDHHQPLSQRVEEMKVAVANVISDLVTEVHANHTDLYTADPAQQPAGTYRHRSSELEVPDMSSGRRTPIDVTKPPTSRTHRPPQ